MDTFLLSNFFARLIKRVSGSEIITFDALEGYVDGFDGANLRGWIWCQTAPSACFSVDAFLDDGIHLGRYPASLYREDLRQAGKGTGWCAFDIDLRGRVAFSGPFTISVFVSFPKTLLLGCVQREKDKVVCSISGKAAKENFGSISLNSFQSEEAVSHRSDVKTGAALLEALHDTLSNDLDSKDIHNQTMQHNRAMQEAQIAIGLLNELDAQRKNPVET